VIEDCHHYLLLFVTVKFSFVPFNATEIPILGVWVRNGEVQMKEEKVKAIKE